MLGIYKILLVLYENVKGKSCGVFLFIHLLKCLCDLASSARGRRLLCFKSVIHGFEPLIKLSFFEDPFFLVTLVSSEAHATIPDAGNGVEGRRAYLFPKY